MRVLALAALLLLPTLSSARPTVEVKARQHLVVNAKAKGLTATVSGALLDDLGIPVPGEPLTIEAEGHRSKVRTDGEGRFRLELDFDGPGQKHVEVRAAATSLRSAAESRARVEVGRTTVTLRFDAPSEVSVGAPVPVEVTASTSEGNLRGALIHLSVNDQPLGARATNNIGRADISLDQLAPGLHTLKAVFKGDQGNLGAEATHSIKAMRSLVVELQATNPEPAAGEPVVLEGQVLGPGAAVSVVLMAAGKPTERGRTTDAGRFRFVLDPHDLPIGEVVFRATAHTARPGWRDGLSKEVMVTIEEPPPPSPAWIWGPAVVALLSMLGALLRSRSARPEAAEAAPTEPMPLPAFTFRAATVKRPELLFVEVRNGLDGALMEATVVLMPRGVDPPPPASPEVPPGERARTEQGTTRLRGEGDYLWAYAEGFAPACHRLPGGQGDITIHLLPVRARLQTLYAGLLRRAGRPLLRFGRQTPREARRPLAERGAPAKPLDSMTALVEQGCYDAPSPQLEALAAGYNLESELRDGIEGR